MEVSEEKELTSKLIWLPRIADELYLSHLIRLATINTRYVSELLGGARAELRGLRDIGMHLSKLAQVFSGRIEHQWNFRLNSTLIAFFIDQRISDAMIHTWPEQVLSAMLRSRTSLGGTMRMCPACVSEELRGMGFPIWHLTHQFPHTFVCLFHRCLLVEVDMQEELRLPQLRVPRTYLEPSNEFERLHSFSIADRIAFNACLSSASRKSLCLAIRDKLGHKDVGRLRALELAAAIRHALPMRLAGC